MNALEKFISNAVVLLVFCVGLAVIISDILNGYTSFVLYLIPSLFVIIPLIFFFEKQIQSSSIFKLAVNQLKQHPMLFIYGFLFLFLALGVTLTGVLMLLKVTDVMGYFVSISFIVLPSFILYGLKYGFTIPESTLKYQEERRETLEFDEQNLNYTMPLFEVTVIIPWTSIESILYTNYRSDDNAEYTFYLNSIPIYKMNEYVKWYNRIFPLSRFKRKTITIDDDCRNFYELPKMIEKYLNQPVDGSLFKDSRKGTLIHETVEYQSTKTITSQHWKPNTNYQPESVLFDKYGRTFEEIRK